MQGLWDTMLSSLGSSCQGTLRFFKLQIPRESERVTHLASEHWSNEQARQARGQQETLMATETIQRALVVEAYIETVINGGV